MTASHSDFLDKVTEARDAICLHKLFQPEIGIVLGSGLGGLADTVEHSTKIPYSSIPHFPGTHAVGHSGNLILGFLSGLPVAMLQGRSHRYEGFSNREVGFPVACLHALGAHTLITTNAAGGLNTRFQAGDLMVIDSHIDLLWERRGSIGPWAGDPPALEDWDAANPAKAIRLGTTYDYELIRQVQSIARRNDLLLHQGCYLATLGPTYETRSEYRMFRAFGADAVGMSTVPEVLVARRGRMRVLAFSVITNVASTDIPHSTSHEEVVDFGNVAGPNLMKIIRQLLENLAGQPD